MVKLMERSYFSDKSSIGGILNNIIEALDNSSVIFYG